MKTLLIIFLFLSSIAYSQDSSFYYTGITEYSYYHKELKRWVTTNDSDEAEKFGVKFVPYKFSMNLDMATTPRIKPAFIVEDTITFKKYPHKSTDLEFPFGEGQSIIFKKYENETLGISLFRGGMCSDFGVLSENEFETLKDFISDGGSSQGQQDSPIDSLRKSIEGEIKLIQQALTKDNTDNIQFLIGKLEALQVVLFEMKKYGLIK